MPSSAATAVSFADHLNKSEGAAKDDLLRHSVSTALKILGS
jgi:hypothetical protein